MKDIRKELSGVVIYCSNEIEYGSIMRELDKIGIIWCNGTGLLHGREHYDDVCLAIDYNGMGEGVSHSNLSFFKRQNNKILSYRKFINLLKGGCIII